MALILFFHCKYNTAIFAWMCTAMNKLVSIEVVAV